MPEHLDIIFQGRAKYRKKYAEEIRHRDRYDLFVVSFPKSGRTWHRAMVGSYLAIVQNRDLAKIFDLPSLASGFGIGTVRYSHNGANFIDGLEPDEAMVASADLWRGKPVVLIVRAVRDILVSAWHHARFRDAITTADLSEFVRNSATGIEKILCAYNRWHRTLDQASRSLILSYEGMHSDPHAVLRSTLVFMGISEPDEAALAAAVAQCGFDTMQTRELTGFYKAEIATTTSDDVRARKAREGKIGRHVDYLGADDLDFIDSVERQIGNPFAPHSAACGPERA